MQQGQELVVVVRTYDLILWSCHHTSKFPRNHRFVRGERIERNLRFQVRLATLREQALRARSVRNR
jgi:hypothetical protein